jgi:hypothetical protein
MRAAKIEVLFHRCWSRVRDGYGRRIQRKENGELLALADKQFDVLITVDKNIRHQQSIRTRKVALVVIRSLSNDLDDIRPHIDDAIAALRSIRPGEVIEIGVGSGPGLM